jgi:hypothetical protein
MKKQYIIILTLIILSTTFSGCSILLKQDKGRSRGSLKDGAKKASNNYNGNRTINTTYEDEKEDAEETKQIVKPVKYSKKTANVIPDSLRKSYGARDYMYWRINATSGSLHSNDFYGYHQLGLGLTGFISKDIKFSMDINYGYSNVQETSELSQSLKDGISIFNLNFMFHRHFTKHYTFMSPYIGGGIGLTSMKWKYQNPLIIQDIDDVIEIDSDKLWGADLFISTGITVFQTSPFNLSFEAVSGVKVWGDQTVEDFTNDLFDPMPYINLMIHLEFKTKLKRQ